MNDLRAAAKVVVEQCLNVRPDEQVLIVIDTLQQEIGRVLLEASESAGAEVILMEMTPRRNHGQEPPHSVAAAMLKADVAILATSKSLSHTNARKEATKAGARIASMPMITTEIMARTLNGDYLKMSEQCARYADAIENAKQIHITSPAGTDLCLSLSGRKAHQDVGILNNSGSMGNLPAGEVYAAPLEGTSEGVLVIDGSMAGIGILTEPLRINVRKGYAEEISGKDAEALKAILGVYGRDAYNIAELGLGMNPKAIISGNVLEDEKIMGTVHIALGDNVSMGGTVSVPSHLDGIVLSPTLEVDGRLIIKEGKLIL